MNDLVCALLSVNAKAATWNKFYLTFDTLPGISWKSKQCNQKTLKQCREGCLCIISSFPHPFTGLLSDLLPRVSDSKYQIMSVSLPFSPFPVICMNSTKSTYHWVSVFGDGIANTFILSPCNNAVINEIYNVRSILHFLGTRCIWGIHICIRLIIVTPPLPMM